jgi:hypothetical protein
MTYWRWSASSRLCGPGDDEGEGKQSSFRALPAAAGYGTLCAERKMKVLTLCTGFELKACPMSRARRS